MRVCFDARTAEPSFPGIGRYAFNLARSLIPQLGPADHLHILRPAGGPAADRIAAMANDRVDSDTLPCSPRSLRQQWIVPRAIRAAGADVYHSCYVGMPLSASVPTVLTVHDLIPLRIPETVPGPKGVAFRLLLRRAAHASDAIIAPSEQTAADLRELLGIARDRIHVIPYAADPDLVAANTQATRTPTDAPFALCVGAARPHKNHVRLIEAWSAVRPAIQLVIAGPGHTPPSAAVRRAEALGIGNRVRWRGEVSDAELAALYYNAVLVVVPSEIEGFGLPAVEAMASGAPLACSDTAALREVAGDAAAYFPAHDVDAMANVIGSLLNDRARLDQLAHAGLARAAAFSWEETARRTIEVYRSIRRGR
jgi:alpha-1,3-rhamnosyl/mannosyltransferase